MRIAEIFYSIQGEGQLTGVPSVFVRTSGCNLRCRWCDTKYASWTPTGKDWSIREILDEVANHPAKHVVITGGEPMIAKNIHELANSLRDRGFHITIETAGTVSPDEIACDLASLSPKLAHSTPLKKEIADSWRARHERLRLQPEILQEWLENYEFQLKFVVSDAELTEIDEVLEALPPVLPHQVLLMPEGVDSKQLAVTENQLIKLCKERGFRYCPRLHIALFGNTPGT